jgi:hypothetical protein
MNLLYYGQTEGTVRTMARGGVSSSSQSCALLRSEPVQVRPARPAARWQRTVMAVLLLFALVGCRTSPGPEPVVERFLRAFNDKDVNVLLACVDPRQERLFRASFRIVEKLTGGWFPVEDVLELVPGLYQAFQKDLSEDFSLRDVQVYRATINGEEAQVPVILTASARSRGVVKDARQRMQFRLRRFDEGWRIVGIQQ